MAQISLKKLLSKKEALAAVQAVISGLDAPVFVRDADGALLVGEERADATHTFPVDHEGEPLGWVAGPEKARSLADFLAYLAQREAEKKTLASEALRKYREITLLYDITDKIAACLDIKEISRLIISEINRLVKGNTSLMLLNEGSGVLDIISASGREYTPKVIIRPGQGIAGCVFVSGSPEIIDDVLTDPRYIRGPAHMRSLICTPLKVKDKVMGIVNVSSEAPFAYTAEDLKLLNVVAYQAAAAIENARLLESRLKEERARSNLERYLAPQLVKVLMEAGGGLSLTPAKADIAVLFSDIRNFSSACEQLPPERLVTHLNEYFTALAEVIFAHGGTLNKFVGDMIVAFFGAPAQSADREKTAIETAVDMQRRIKAMKEPWIREHFHTGIGINSGEVILGNIGSPRHMDYTAIGDGVNIAQRLESMARGGQILVSRSVYDATRDIFRFREIGHVNVKGKDKAIEVFEVLYEQAG